MEASERVGGVAVSLVCQCLSGALLVVLSALLGRPPAPHPHHFLQECVLLRDLLIRRNNLCSE